MMSLLNALFGGQDPAAQTRQAPNKADATGKAAPAAGTSLHTGDQVSLGAAGERAQPLRIEVTAYKSSVGQDTAFVRETLRHKLAEYQLNPATRVAVSKNSLGQIELDARMPAETRNRIELELNQNSNFRDAFNRLSVNQPTLEYLDNVTKVNKAYGTDNPVVRSLLSQDRQFNQLTDIAHRYEALRQTVASSALPAATMAGLNDDMAPRRFAVSLNA